MQDGPIRPSDTLPDIDKKNPENVNKKLQVPGIEEILENVMESPIQQFNELFSEIKNMNFPVYIDSDGWRINIRAIIYKNTKIKGIEIRRTNGEEREPVPTLRLSESGDSFKYYAHNGMHWLDPEEEINEKDNNAIKGLLCLFKEHISKYKDYRREIKQPQSQHLQEFIKIIKELPESPETDDDDYAKGKYILDAHGEIKLGIWASNFDGFNDYDEITLVKSSFNNERISLYYNWMDGNFYLETPRYNKKYYKLNEEEIQKVLEIIKNIDNCDTNKLFDIIPSGYWKYMRKDPS